LLFKTIYGPELESVYFWLERFGPAGRIELADAFGGMVTGGRSSAANLEDALSFLGTAGVITRKRNLYRGRYRGLDSTGFKTTLLRHLRAVKKKNGLDPYFLGLVDILYIKPDTSFHNGLHRLINSLDLPGPCSEEKVNAWRRVVEYLGLGLRGFGGLAVQYDAGLLERIIGEWDDNEGPLQLFLEGHLNRYLPWATIKGEIASAVALPLEQLEATGKIHLMPKQDLPYKGYMGKRKVKWLVRGDTGANSVPEKKGT
jgi:hypothetical protein